MKKKALIIVDVQNDFCEGGSLEVSEANEIVPFINRLVEQNDYHEIVLTQDFHPKEHKSFAMNNGEKIGNVIKLNGLDQIMWPAHCVQNTFGAEFHKNLNAKKATHIVRKGTNPEIDSYSAFFDNKKLHDTGLSAYLKKKEIENVEIVGLALDYCVKYTCLDALAEGFGTTLYFKGTRAVNINPNDERDTLFELIKKGVDIIS